ncbi:sensor histidine kinase [Cohnella hashimotonis]|uniref:Histidine kinase n=1 Tax=Cohnella hashimotonis TaxID=2826895 RepID=A0ABT6TFU7_9BACL|nr:histidine kinase [Cohnella hashimotonis]MDI4645173.1 histidine kinase [Cohnella hashimotonis]
MNATKNKPFINSIRFKLIAGLLVIVLPIIAYLIYNNVYSIKVVRNQVAESSSNTVGLYMDIVDQTLDSVDAYLLRFIIEENGLLPLESAVSKDPDTYQLERIRVFQKMSKDMYYYQMIDFNFIYSSVKDELILVQNQQAYRTEAPDWRGVNFSLSEFIHSHLSKAEFEKRWFDMKIGDDYYLMRMIRSGKLYVGMGINVEHLLGPMHLLNFGENVTALFTDASNEPLQDARAFTQQDIDFAFQNDKYKLTGDSNRYLLVGKASSKGPFNLVALVPDDVILEQLPYLLRITYLIAGAFIVIVVIALLALRKIVLLPIFRILFAMRKVKEGSLNARVPSSSSSNEFETMNETFNDMVSEIQQLKIDIYEEQLAKQKAELKQLQLQINPHFFLNSLNIVYYLAKERKYSLIQELSLSLIQYFRFMFRSGTDYVSLGDEIKHTENYLRIQTFRFPESLTYRTDIQERVLSVSLPPLVIQTFVENSVKYAIDTDRETHIQILAWQSSTEEMCIRIKDTGNGFPEHILQTLQENRIPASDTGEQIGIWNVKRRLELLYNGEADVRFYNDEGAVVEIALPLKCF